MTTAITLAELFLMEKGLIRREGVKFRGVFNHHNRHVLFIHSGLRQKPVTIPISFGLKLLFNMLYATYASFSDLGFDLGQEVKYLWVSCSLF